MVTNVTPYTGQTIRVTASAIVDAAGVAIPAPTVTFTVTDPNGTVTTPSVTQSGSAYYIEFVSNVVGEHIIRATASGGSGVAKEIARVTVYAF